ncbi:hypothetical protein CEP51_010143 [Fusarium floridanum]|uniref:Mitochondrial carrier n=1 Tax=Fusarium floridanum TaxID=1325733 RepID=A0A428RFC4_9HYPO|nr:hypothetical protein CEP51_010143 [Fusarium floridanum]
MSSDTAKNIVAGTMGGVAQVMIGQPFDIVKVRLQASGGNALTVTGNIWRREGPLAFYKRNTDGTLSLAQFYLAGGAAGLSNSVLSGPIEHVRIRLQTQPHGSNRLYAGPTDCVRKIWKHSGIRGLYRGQVVTILREFHGFGIWFASYEGLIQKVMKQDQTPRSEIPSWKFALCGGIAGELIWLLTYPFDMIKSKMQTDGFGVERRYKNMREAFRVTLEVGGVAGLFKGIGPTLLRAMPVSAGTFAV